MDAGPSSRSLSPAAPSDARPDDTNNDKSAGSPSPAAAAADDNDSVTEEEQEDDEDEAMDDAEDEDDDAGDISTDEDIDPLPAVADPDALAKEREQQSSAAKAQQAATVIAEGDAGKKIHGDAKGMADFDLPKSIVTRIAKSEVSPRILAETRELNVFL